MFLIENFILELAKYFSNIPKEDLYEIDLFREKIYKVVGDFKTEVSVKAKLFDKLPSRVSDSWRELYKDKDIIHGFLCGEIYFVPIHSYEPRDFKMQFKKSVFEGNEVYKKISYEFNILAA